MPIKTEIVISTIFKATHNWPEAKHDPDVEFLSYPHRHRFIVKMFLQVTHSNREFEFFKMELQLRKFILNNIIEDCEGVISTVGSKSCEMMAFQIRDYFDATRVEVWEDGENGAVVSYLED